MKRSLLGMALAAALAPLAGAQNLVVFGDSLSDTGNNNLKATYTGADGKLGSLYDEIIAQRLGSQLTPSTQGGSNYAYSGGVANGAFASPAVPKQALQLQVDEYVASGKVDPNALHIVWGGGNDLAAILTRAQATANPTASVLADTSATAAATAKQLATLKQAGVQTVIVPSAPNVALTPLLYQQFANGVGASLKAQINQQAPGMGDQVQQVYNQAFQAASAKLKTSSQSSMADLDATRLAVLSDTIAAVYATSMGPMTIGQALSANGLTEAQVNALIAQQYQQTLSSAAQATTTLNSATSEAVAQTGANVLRLDTNQLFTDVLSNPKQYGFDNTAGAPCVSTAQIACTYTGSTRYFFADGFHPGPAAHQLMADYLLSVWQAPQDMAVMRSVQQGLLNQSGSYLAHDLAASRLQGPRPAGSFEAIGGYTRNSGDVSGNDLHLGAKAQFSERWQGGVLFSRLSDDVDSGHTQVKAKANIMTGFARYELPQAWVGGFVRIGDSEYQTQRQIALGSARINQSGEAGGSELALGVDGGYEFDLGRVKAGPIAELSFAKGHVGALTEQGSGATKMSFGEQAYRSVRLGVGAQLSTEATAKIRPFAQVKWLKEFKNNDQSVEASTGGSRFTVEGAAADRSWVEAGAGVNWDITPKVRSFVSLHKQFGRSNQEALSINLGVGARF